MWTLSRRALLRGAASLGALGLASHLSLGCDEDDPEPDPNARPIEKRTLQFSLDHLPTNIVYTLEVAGSRYVLARHTKDSLAEQRQQNAMLSAIPDAELTHFVKDVVLIGDMPQSYIVTYGIQGTERRGMALAGIHVPSDGIKVAQALKGDSIGFLSFRRRQYGIKLVPPQTMGGLHTLECKPGGIGGDLTDLADFVDEYDAARYLVYHHPDILSLDAAVSATLMHHLDCADGLAELAQAVIDAGAAVGPDEDDVVGWCHGVYTLDPDGRRVTQEDEDGKALFGPDGKPLYQWTYRPTEKVAEVLGRVIQAALLRVTDDSDLDRKRFHIEEARTTREGTLPDTGPKVLRADANSAPYTFAISKEAWVRGQCISNLRVEDAATRKVSFDVANSYNRHIGVSYAFLDAGNKPIKIGDMSDAGPGRQIGGINLDSTYTVFEGILGPPPWLLGIPLPEPLDVTRERYTVTIPRAATKLAVLTGTLAEPRADLTDAYSKVMTPGVLMTIVAEFGVPVVALAWGMRASAREWKQLTETLVVPALTLVGKIGQNAGNLTHGDTWANLGIWAANFCIKTVIAKGASSAGVWLKLIAAGNITRGIPILGAAIAAVQALDTAHQLARTGFAIGLGGKVCQTLITTTNKVRFHIKPTSKLGFPATATTYEIIITPPGGSTSDSRRGDFDILATPSSFDVTFPETESGGRYSYVIYMKSANGFTAGLAVGSFKNLIEDGGSEVVVDVGIVNQPIPITKDTVYSPLSKLTIDGGKHKWVKAEAATLVAGSALSCEGAAERICAPSMISINADLAQLAYTWNASEAALPLCGTETKSTSLHTFQNLSLDVTVKDDPDQNLRNLGCGLNKPIFPLYPLEGPDAYVLESSTGSYVLRKYDLAETAERDFRKGPVIATLTSKSVVAAAIMGNSYVMALGGDGGADVVEVVDLKTGIAQSLSAAPLAAIYGKSGSIRGSLSNAVGICRAYDGDVFLILENGNKRIQALSPDGKPVVDYFTNADGIQSALCPLAATSTYLDITVEYKSGTIYVLSRVGTQDRAQDFRLDIYERKTSAILATTTGLAAAKLCLDNNQNIFALGWDVLTFQNQRQPGVWKWIPSTPPGYTP